MLQLPGFTDVAILYDNHETRRSVYSAQHPTHGKVAIKIIGCTSQNTMLLAERETNIGIRAQHPSICKVHERIMKSIEGDYESQYLMIVMPYIASDLGKEIVKRSKGDSKLYWSEDSLWNMMMQVVNALKYAQTNNICHRDIKPQNLLISEKGQVYVADFGSGKSDTLLEKGRKHTVTGTLTYFSPEMLAFFRKYLNSGDSSFNYNPYKSDVFSLGITLIHIMSLHRPDNIACPDGLSVRVGSVLHDFCSHYSDELLTIVGAMMEENIDLRPDFVELDYMVRIARQDWSMYVTPIKENYWYVKPPQSARTPLSMPISKSVEVIDPTVNWNSDPRCPIDPQTPRGMTPFDSSTTQLMCDNCRKRQGYVITLSCRHSYCIHCVKLFNNRPLNCLVDGRPLNTDDERKIRYQV